MERAEDYDLFEAKTLFGRRIDYSNLPVDVQLEQAASQLTALSYFIGSDFRENLQYIRTHQRYLPDGVHMGSVVTDLGVDNPPVAPAGCSIEYVGYYQNDGTIMIAKNVFEKLSSTDQAAFYAHETLYRMARNFSRATDSQMVRRLNAFLWSHQAADTISDALPFFTWNSGQPIFHNTSTT